VLLILFLISISFGQNVDSTGAKSPRKAALWSILPGGGQIYNKKYLKAGILITLESLAVWQSLEKANQYQDDPSNELLTNRNKFAWWALLVHIYGTLDAVVDSHLKPFNEMMKDEAFEEENIIEEKTPDG
jgi:hypothetical protein